MENRSLFVKIKQFAAIAPLTIGIISPISLNQTPPPPSPTPIAETCIISPSSNVNIIRTNCRIDSPLPQVSEKKEYNYPVIYGLGTLGALLGGGLLFYKIRSKKRVK